MNMEIVTKLQQVRSALFLPASNSRAIEKARGLEADLVILDLEDAVKDEDKDVARKAAVEALAAEWPCLVAVRVNGTDTPWHGNDVSALSAAGAPLLVMPKAETCSVVEDIAARANAGLLAMIETPVGVYAARDIAAHPGVVGLIAGTNDLGAEMRLSPDADRLGLTLALQSIVLAARAAGVAALDGVFNRLDDAEGFAAECSAGRRLGFDGKTLIHPSQIEPANRLFGPSEAELEDARALIEAAGGGAERFRGRMIETLHVRQAERLIARAR